MSKAPKSLIWGLWALFTICALYPLTSPFVMPRVFDNATGRLIYAPVAYSLQKAWFGRPLVDWYCYDICKMPLFLPREPAE